MPSLCLPCPHPWVLPVGATEPPSPPGRPNPSFSRPPPHCSVIACFSWRLSAEKMHTRGASGGAEFPSVPSEPRPEVLIVTESKAQGDMAAGRWSWGRERPAATRPQRAPKCGWFFPPVPIQSPEATQACLPSRSAIRSPLCRLLFPYCHLHPPKVICHPSTCTSPSGSGGNC